MADRHFRSLFRAPHLRREQWTFLLMALLCVSVIVGTALWTRQADPACLRRHIRRAAASAVA